MSKHRPLCTKAQFSCSFVLPYLMGFDYLTIKASLAETLSGSEVWLMSGVQAAEVLS